MIASSLDNDDKDDDDEMLVEFLPSHIDLEMSSSLDSLANLIRRSLE